MKILTLTILLFFSYARSQNNINVMSYYAADNSIDGQPMIDKTNVLRFYPVFNIREDIERVSITLYINNDVIIKSPIKMNNGQFWKTQLPNFTIGDAIQRIECEVTFKLDDYYSARLRDLKVKQNKLIELTNKITLNNYKEFLNSFKLRFNEEYGTDKIIALKSIYLNNNYNENLKSHKDAKKAFDSLSPIKKAKAIEEIETLEIQKFKYSSRIDKAINQVKLSEDSLKNRLFNEITQNLSEKQYSGPAIRPYDITLSDDFETATILYRYYKNNLRYRKALDPAESLGIFRFRYVPFVVSKNIRDDDDNTTKLYRPFATDNPTVFEIGISFKDRVVTGDETFTPGLSWDRMGVAIGVTNKLFSKDAKVIALALSYDVNSYVNISVGRNLARDRDVPYFGLGINSIAFRDLVAGLNKMF